MIDRGSGAESGCGKEGRLRGCPEYMSARRGDIRLCSQVRSRAARREPQNVEHAIGPIRPYRAASVEIARRVRDELGTTIVWVEHVMSAVIQLAERAIVLNFGEILTEGVPEDVMRHPAVIDAYLGQAADAA